MLESTWLKLARPAGSYWEIDERDAQGAVIGTARRDASGRKSFIRGGARGLILPWPLDAYAGTSVSEPVFVCEGATDTAALLGLGFDAVGVPMAGHCGEMLAELLTDRHVVFVTDADHAGRQGASKLAAVIASRCSSVRIIEPPASAKDARAAVIAGANEESFRSLVAAAEPEATSKDSSPPPEIARFVPFPLHLLPEPIRSFVAEASKSIGCDPCFIALPLFAGLASAIGNSCKIEIKRDWTMPMILWTAIIGESGTAKSPAIEMALGAIRKRQARAMQEHRLAMAEHAEAVAIFERDSGQWKKSRSNLAPPVKPEAPTPERCWVDDVTTEAVAVLLQQNPRGLLMIRDELSGWFNFDRYSSGKGGDVARWIEMSGGRPMTVDRKGSGTLYVPRASVSIAGGIQPETLRRVISVEHTENGLASRILMAFPPKRCPGYSRFEVSAVTEAAVERVFDRLFALTPTSPYQSGDDSKDLGDEWGIPRLLKLDEHACDAMIQWVDYHAVVAQDLSGAAGYAWGKLKGMAATLAGVIHLVRRAAGSSPGTLEVVDRTSMEVGITIARWFGNEARRIYEILHETEGERDRRELIDLIQNRGGAISVRELSRGPRKYRNLEFAVGALKELVAEGYGRWECDDHGGGRGRSVDRFRLIGRGGGGGDGDTNGTNTAGDPISVTVTTAQVCTNPAESPPSKRRETDQVSGRILTPDSAPVPSWDSNSVHDRPQDPEERGVT